MSVFSNHKVMGATLIIATGAFFFFIAQKPAPASPPPLATEQSETNRYIEEAEKRREQMLEAEAIAQKQEKLRKEKEGSVECQFWKQQKNEKSSARVDEKISEFCGLANNEG